MNDLSFQDLYEQLTHGCVQITPQEEFKKLILSGKKLRVKLGVDPTAPDLHLGHCIILQKLRQFQKAGHTVIFLIGDFTALIGDPTGKSKTRPPLLADQILENTKTYFEQVGRVLDKDKTEIMYNSTWLSKLTFEETLRLLSKVTVAHIAGRDDFDKRLKEHTPVFLHEFMYPIMQGYDSVALKADIELGGTDQTFNLLMGRHLQEYFQQPPQIIMTLPLLVGTDGKDKMSKSLGNYIALSDTAEQAYAKCMSLSDQTMWHYIELFSTHSSEKQADLKRGCEEGNVHPMEVKKEMAFTIVERFWSLAQAEHAAFVFKRVVQEKELDAAAPFYVSLPSTCWIVDLLKQIGVVTSSSEAKRLIEAGSVELDGKSVASFNEKVTWQEKSTLRAGKKHLYRLFKTTT